MAATTTARPTRQAVHRVATDTTNSSTVASATNSPFDSPKSSPSNTSLSSLASDADINQKVRKSGKLLDTYGNEFTIPDYTIKDIHDAIPKHCFERSAVTGLYYVARDLVFLATTFYLFNTYATHDNIPSKPLYYAAWAFYTFVQGLVGTGVWVLAHECGHQSFSPSKTLNDTVGWVLHSALLVPYFSWKISHGKHHKATGHMERDMVFVPSTREEYASKTGQLLHELHEATEETPIATALHLFGQQLAGWLLYLITNTTGHNFHERQTEGKGKGKVNGWSGAVNHFLPSSPLYEKKDEHLILLSDLGIALTGLALYFVGKNYGFANLFTWYIVPYLWVNHWLVYITFLQHTDPSLPHYEAGAWTFTRGAAATIDRNFWPIGPYLFHDIIETHVLHHYISTIPFYHAEEATAAIKPVMGSHYRADTRGGALGFLSAFWRTGRMCQWVERPEGSEDGVLFFRNRNGLGVPPSKLAAPAS
ncbi:hypothetical protein FH972_022152 [Carpinus fangiana]|uniref:Fatty acid desaturase domain-containing protein n=1 Tax=Carpinus fangiana TaxID=176857 RepID=A0A5N6KRS0_9ROSI|nr:hypothetical protein FH972_022152 [Carpinus fangiana]